MKPGGGGAARVVAVVDAEHVVRRGHHVEVEVEADVGDLLLGQLADVVLEPSRPDSSAPHQAKRTVLAGLTLAIWIAVSSSAALPEPLSLMPAPVLDGVEVRAGHDDVVVVAGAGLGDHVVGLARLRGVVDGHGHGRARASARGRSRRRTSRTRPGCEARGVADHVEQPGAARLALVHDDDGGRAGGLRVEHLDVEATRAALDERDRAGRECRRSRRPRSRSCSSSPGRPG